MAFHDIASPLWEGQTIVDKSRQHINQSLSFRVQACAGVCRRAGLCIFTGIVTLVLFFLKNVVGAREQKRKNQRSEGSEERRAGGCEGEKEGKKRSSQRIANAHTGTRTLNSVANALDGRK